MDPFMALEALAIFGTSLHAEKLWLAVLRAPDGGWAEESVAVVGIDLVAARSLGREFGQNAVFEVADGMLRVHACFDGWIDERPL